MARKRDRQRRLAREHHRRQLERQVRRSHRARVATIASVACCAVIGLAAGGFFLFQGGGKSASASASPSPSPSPSASASASASAAAEPATHCRYIAHPPAARPVGTPPATPDSTATYQATIRTNRGPIVIDLLNSKATCTVNSFVYLASKKYFNNTPCPRLTTSGLYVLQCGDPTGKGTGGPGYKFADENLAGATYTAGVVAMANSGPNTNGSQFFIVYKNSQSLPPKYTPFGKVVKGLGIIQNVAKSGTDNANAPGDGHPKEKVVIESVSIKKT